MQQQTYVPTDLVFAISGGPRDGERLPINARKCVLAFGDEPVSNHAGNSQEKPRIAIYRGAGGVTVRIESGEILVNGESKDSHWLESGDEIQFPNAVVLRVTQLGSMAADPADSQGEFESPVPSNESLVDSNPNHFTPPNPPEAQRKLDRLETQVSEIQQQNQQVQGRFNELDQRLSQLTDQLSTLVTLATTGPLVQSAPRNEAPFNEAPLSPARRSAETVLDFEVENERFQFESQDSDTQVKSSMTSDAAISEFTDNAGDVDPIDPPLEKKNELENKSVTEYGTESDLSSENESIVEPEPSSNSELDSMTEQDYLREFASPSSEEHSPDVGSVEYTHENSAAEDERETDAELNDGSNPGAESTTDDEFDSESNTTSDSTQARQPESVTDLLARMKAEGQWRGVDEVDEKETIATEKSMITTPVHVSSPAPQQDAQIAKSSVSVEPDVEDYMSQLLTRMRGGAEPTPQPAAAAVAKFEPSEEPDSRAVPENVAPMTQEEFVPKQRAAKLESLGAMREIANSTARTAVADSEEDRRKALALVQLAISIGSLIMAVYYFLFLCQSIGDVHSIVGLTCMGISGFLGYRYYATIYPSPAPAGVKG